MTHLSQPLFISQDNKNKLAEESPDRDLSDQSTWDNIEDFLDREGLFIFSPSDLFNQRAKEAFSSEFKKKRSLTSILGKTSPLRNEGEMINTNELPTFLARRAKSFGTIPHLITK